jgi:hypothetical protein
LPTIIRPLFGFECIGQVLILVFGNICRLAGAEDSDADPERLKNSWEFFCSLVLNIPAIDFSRFGDSRQRLALVDHSLR